MSKNISLLLILLSILLITNISLNLISNEKYIDYTETKPNFYYNSENVREYDLYNKLINLNNIFVDNNLGSLGFIQRDLNDKMDDIEVKVGSDNGSIRSAIDDFKNRKNELQALTTCINEGKNVDSCYLAYI
tara:strand:- start:65 stop:460 length:396 start_codon:yes stop_codon:yes gene_type:complete